MKKIALIILISFFLPLGKVMASGGGIMMMGPCIVFTELNKPFYEMGARAFDSLNNDITSMLLMNSNLDITKPGKYYIEYSVPDSIAKIKHQRRIVVVGDNIFTADTNVINLPVFFPGDSVASLINSLKLQYGLDINVSGGNVTYNQVGTSIVRLDISDSLSACFVSFMIIVNVVDLIPPVLFVLGVEEIRVCTWDEFDPFKTGVVMNDNYDSIQNLTISVFTDMPKDSSGKYSSGQPGTWVVNYVAKDRSGNVSDTAIKIVSFVICEGIEELNQMKGIEIYPNPCADFITLNFHSKQESTIQIYNTAGECVLNKEISGSTEKLDLTDWQKGLYLVSVSGDAMRTSFKFVKQ